MPKQSKKKSFAEKTCAYMSQDTDFTLSSYRFELPESQIAQYPPEERGASRLLVMDRTGTHPLEHSSFSQLTDFLPPKALLVVNNSRVLQARLQGVRATGGKVEFLLLTPLPLLGTTARPVQEREGWFMAEAEGLLRAGGRIAEGEKISFGDRIAICVLRNGAFGRRQVQLFWRGDAAEAFAAIGHVPLPPYIRRTDETGDLKRYQTIFAREEKNGSVAAPTAGLHFTPQMRESLVAQGFQFAEVTLYVGYGTFSPVREQDIRKHQMHSEYVEISDVTASSILQARAEGRPVIAVGTTALRTLEGVAWACGEIRAFSGWTDIFLYPGASFSVVDGLITNFHLPESSLLMLVSAFAGRERILAAYQEAVHCGYRFFSYGDAMFIR